MDFLKKKAIWGKGLKPKKSKTPSKNGVFEEKTVWGNGLKN